MTEPKTKAGRALVHEVDFGGTFGDYPVGLDLILGPVLAIEAEAHAAALAEAAAKKACAARDRWRKRASKWDIGRVAEALDALGAVDTHGRTGGSLARALAAALRESQR